MTNMEEKLVHLITVDDLSSVQMMSDELGIPQEEIRTLLTKLTQEGTINGHLTEEGARYFKHDAKVSEAPVIDRRVDVPDFMKFDERPGQIAAIFGLVVTSIGTYALMNAGGNLGMETFGALFMLIGVAVMLAGGFYISMRKTPS
ncbi:MAG: hypothetical protein RTU09_03690 [Candidatus Thorarchaeota archaeon]